MEESRLSASARFWLARREKAPIRATWPRCTGGRLGWIALRMAADFRNPSTWTV
jgi:hypothetical protein